MREKEIETEVWMKIFVIVCLDADFPSVELLTIRIRDGLSVPERCGANTERAADSRGTHYN